MPGKGKILMGKKTPAKMQAKPVAKAPKRPQLDKMSVGYEKPYSKSYSYPEAVGKANARRAYNSNPENLFSDRARALQAKEFKVRTITQKGTRKGGK